MILPEHTMAQVQSHSANQLWSSPSKMMSQNQPFLFIKWLSMILCDSAGKLTHTGHAEKGRWSKERQEERTVEGPGTGSRFLCLVDSKGGNDAKQAQWSKPSRTLRIGQKKGSCLSLEPLVTESSLGKAIVEHGATLPCIGHFHFN